MSEQRAVYVLLYCWYEGDSNLVDDSFISASEQVEPLINKANELSGNKEPFICLPGEEMPDDGGYGDIRFRYAIRRVPLLS